MVPSPASTKPRGVAVECAELSETLGPAYAIPLSVTECRSERVPEGLASLLFGDQFEIELLVVEEQQFAFVVEGRDGDIGDLSQLIDGAPAGRVSLALSQGIMADVRWKVGDAIAVRWIDDREGMLVRGRGRFEPEVPADAVEVLLELIPRP